MWRLVKNELPPNGFPVMTKVDDEKGERSRYILVRKGNLWFLPDGSMYVYYVPTHWKYLWD